MGTRYVSLDWAIKRILRSKANFSVLEGFLSELLKRDVKILKLLESETNKERADDKYNRVDLVAADADGSLVIIEVQVDRQDDYLQRVLYGASKAICENIDAGETYASVKKIISVSILYFRLGVGADYAYKGTTAFRGMRKGDVLGLSEDQKRAFKAISPADIFPEYYLLKVNDFDDSAKDGLDEWLYFLKHDGARPRAQAKGLAQARKILEVSKLGPEERRAYERFQDDLHQRASMATQPERQQRVIDEMAREIAAHEQALRDHRKALEDKDKALEDKDKALEDNRKVLENKDKALEDQERLIEELKRKLAGKS